MEDNIIIEIKRIITVLGDKFNDQIFIEHKSFSAAVSDISQDSAAKNLLRIAVCELNAYNRLKIEYKNESAFIIHNLVNEMAKGYMIDLEVTESVINCLAEYVGYANLPSVSQTGRVSAEEDFEDSQSNVAVVIRAMFTDKALREELAALNESIASCSAELISLPSEIANANSLIIDIEIQQRQYLDMCHAQGRQGFETIRQDYQYKYMDEQKIKIAERKYEAESRIRSYSSLKVECESRKHEIEELLLLTPMQRMERYYQELLTTKNEAIKGGVDDSDELRKLADEFREMNGYKDSDKLADECEGKIYALMYEDLVSQIENANELDDLNKLLNGLRNFDPKDAAVLANKHEQKVCLLRYNGLLLRMKEASSPKDFSSLADDFRALDYKDSIALADNCIAKADSIQDERDKAKKLLEALREKVDSVNYQVVGFEGHTYILMSDNTIFETSPFFDYKHYKNWTRMCFQTDIVQVSAGTGHVIGLKKDGTVVASSDSEFDCYRDNMINEVNWRKKKQRFSNKYGQCNVSHWQNVIQIAACSANSAALFSNGTVEVLGYNSFHYNTSSWKDLVRIKMESARMFGFKKDGSVVVTGNVPNNIFNASGLSWKCIKDIQSSDHTFYSDNTRDVHINY